MMTPGLERWVYQYFLTSPATGSHTVSVTTANPADIKVVSASYSGASLSQPDNVITRWDPSGSATSTTSLTAITDNSWAMLVGATVSTVVFVWAPLGAWLGHKLGLHYAGPLLTGLKLNLPIYKAKRYAAVDEARARIARRLDLQARPQPIAQRFEQLLGAHRLAQETVHASLQTTLLIARHDARPSVGVSTH